VSLVALRVGGAAAQSPPDEPRALRDEVQGLREDVNALARRPEPATAADLERLRAEVERLVAAQRAIVRRLDEGVSTGVTDSSRDGSATTTPLLLAVGGVLGWATSRLFQRRRAHRRDRLRL
jgi:hypothetical protein